MIRRRLRELEDTFGHKPVVIVTEKVSSISVLFFSFLDIFLNSFLG